MEEGTSALKNLTGKPTGKRPLGRSRRRWEDNIRMDLEEIGINAGNWIDSAQDRNYGRSVLCCHLVTVCRIWMTNTAPLYDYNI